MNNKRNDPYGGMTYDEVLRRAEKCEMTDEEYIAWWDNTGLAPDAVLVERCQSDVIDEDDEDDERR